MHKWTNDSSGKLHPRHQDVDERNVTWDDTIACVGLVWVLGAIIVGVSIL